MLDAYWTAADEDGELALSFFDLIQQEVASSDFSPGHTYWMSDASADGLRRLWRYVLRPYLA